MTHDPFGNLRDWGSVIDLLEELSGSGQLAKCQSGLVRILRYKGNWRLREEVLKRAGDIASPSDELVGQVITILDDDNVYYDARILASDALRKLLKNQKSDLNRQFRDDVGSVVRKLTHTPQPPFFGEALRKLH